jgi:hypothetical protein
MKKQIVNIICTNTNVTMPLQLHTIDDGVAKTTCFATTTFKTSQEEVRRPLSNNLLVIVLHLTTDLASSQLIDYILELN